MKVLTWLNFGGVALVALLCVIQWNVNRRLNLHVLALEEQRQAQDLKSAEQARTIAGCKADLTQLQSRLEQSDAALHESEQKVIDLTAARDKAVSERDQVTAARDRALADRDRVTAALANWQAAVTQRDEALKKAVDEVKAATGERNDVIAKFNDLATRYNTLVKDVNEGRVKPAPAH